MAHIELIQTVAALVLGLVQVYIDPEEVVQALQSRKRRSSCAKSRERLQQHRAPSSSGSSRAKGTKRRGAATSRGLRSEEEGCYTGCTRDYVATEPSYGWTQPVREGEPSEQNSTLESLYRTLSVLSDLLMEATIH